MRDFEEILADSGEVGFVDRVNHSIVSVSGLPLIRPEEVARFESGAIGQVLSLDTDQAEILVFDRAAPAVGEKVARTGESLSVPVGKELLGQVLDSLCRPIAGKTGVATADQRSISADPPGIAHRRKIRLPLETGVSMVDLVVPLGKGQRELVIGDRKTGKSSFLFQTVLTQARQGTVCIYAAIGKKQVDIKATEEFFARKRVLSQVVIIASSSQDPAGMIFLTPYTAMTMAEYFRDQGQEVLLILDDLSTHAKFYREIALLGRRFPGRDSYPGDIFYIHSRLLERAGNFVRGKNEVSITCLPVVESTESDMTGYIQTNLMSMTDGHIFFDTELFTKGRRPAVSPFLSVTRVGRQTQSQVRRDINRELGSLLSLFEKSESFSYFGAGLSEGMKMTLATGEAVYKFFNQSAEETVPIPVQLVLFALLWIGFWQGKTDEKMRADIAKTVAAFESDPDFQTYLTSLSESESFNKLLSRLGTEGARIKAMLTS